MPEPVIVNWYWLGAGFSGPFAGSVRLAQTGQGKVALSLSISIGAREWTASGAVICCAAARRHRRHKHAFAAFGARNAVNPAAPPMTKPRRFLCIVNASRDH